MSEFCKHIQEQLKVGGIVSFGQARRQQRFGCRECQKEQLKQEAATLSTDECDCIDCSIAGEPTH